MRTPIDVNDHRQFPPLPISELGSPTPWEAHPDYHPVYGPGWHLARTDGGSAHDHGSCIAIFFRRDDAELAAELVSKFAAQDSTAFSRPYTITQTPWFVRREDDPTAGTGWHLYAELEGDHQCIATFHRELDAKLTVMIVNGVALLEREAVRKRQEN